ncbi:alpha/beta hydrolase [Novosphingobium piscinae]|uniref:Alpha/beta hydrolase n=1 Tax=Novosphingobium piscinae TaxID=1507448 RepID=A0A7X1FYT1_9SPHN|nr:alpha/beta hydrolase [Novosphingobium piscinae]MBC2668852.1 alpha/beta hydrolase [Novosphingobium piscinae]
MTKIWTLAATLAAALCSVSAAAQPAQPSPPAFRVVPTTPSLRPAIELGGGTGAEQWEAFVDQVSVRNVTGAALYPVLPAKGRGNGQAIIVVPGGGYRFVSIESEGFRVAEALAAEGYAAFVLKYRTTPTARDIPAYLADTMQLFANLGKGELADNPLAVDDLARAIGHVRAHAAEWQVDPARVGVIGFSAGSRTAIRLLETQAGVAGQLATVALLYPPMTQPVKPGPRPPLFLAIASDDPLFRQGKLTLVDQWLNDSPQVEFHLYAGGSHGFGMRPTGHTSDLWIGQYIAWLKRH